MKSNFEVRSRGRVVGRAAVLRTGRLGVRFLLGEKDFTFFFRNGQNASGAYPASYSLGTGFFPGSKAAGALN